MHNPRTEVWVQGSLLPDVPAFTVVVSKPSRKRA
jgi:hypothetical protein